MKILCTADWHIGKKLESFSRLEEQKDILDQIVNISENENIDAVIIAGDCFDIQSPSPEMARLFVSTLARLARGGECPVLVIAGNHDNPLFLSTSEAFASQVGVVILGYPKEKPSLEQNHPAWRVTHRDTGIIEIFFKKSKKTVRFLMSPYANAQRLKKDLGTTDTDKKAWEILCEEWNNNISSDPEVKNILITHSYLLPEKKDALLQEEAPKEDSGERSIVGTIGGISLDHIPNGIDYIIAGHIHNPQKIYSTKTKAFYTGSPLIYSLSESGQKKSLLILDLGRKDKELLIPLTVKKDIKEIRFNNFDTIGTILEQEKENYLILIWEGDRYFTAEEHQYLRASHPYIIRIESRPTSIQKEYNQQPIEKLQEQSTTELFIEYFQSKYQGQLPPEDVLTLFEECLHEETNTSILEKKRGFLPKSLKINGFYSYKKEVFIDFSLLEEKKFFGIFGNTGSGKSALIEAMIIAIYYKVERFGTFGSSGKGQFSNSYGIMNLDSDELLIEFIFEIDSSEGTEEYLCRIHGTRDKKKRTEVKIKREIFLMDQGEWLPIEDKTGEQLIGISYDDFRKTIVLQQRDFLGFISAAPKENTETMMRLFQLERFDLAYVVDRLDKQGFAEYKTLEVQLNSFSKDNAEYLEELQTQHQSLQEKISLLSQELHQKSTTLNTLKHLQTQQQRLFIIQKELTDLETQKSVFVKARERLDIITIIELDNNIQKLITEYEYSLTQKKSLEITLDHDSQQLQQIHKQGDELSQKKEELKEQLTKKQQSWEDALANNITELTLTLEAQEKEYQQFNRSIDQLDDKILVLNNSIMRKEDLSHKVESLKKEEQKLRDLTGLSKALNHLHDKKPCPLCGSLDHPNPCTLEDFSQLDEITQQYQTAYKMLIQIQQAEEQLLELNENKTLLEKQRQDILNDNDFENYEELKTSYHEALTQKLSQEEEISALKTDIVTLKTQYNDISNNVDTLRENYRTIEKQIIHYQADVKNISENITTNKQKQQDLSTQRKKNLEELSINEESIKHIKEYPSKTKQEIEGFFSNYQELSIELKTIDQMLSGQSLDTEAYELLEKEVTDLNTNHQQGLQDLGFLNSTINQVQENLSKKNTLKEQFDLLVVRRDNLELLKKMFKGSGFVHFIGQKYLSKLCYTANQRFLRFTQNQFELSAPDQLDDKKGRIVIIDRLAGGNKRDMLTLSGGQSFQAALALALALSDESGTGHRFFFIDEGFGSLDNDSLYLVLDTLRELAEKENRVVGLISHVLLMREEVSAGLYVYLDKNLGTQVEFQLL